MKPIDKLLPQDVYNYFKAKELISKAHQSGAEPLLAWGLVEDLTNIISKLIDE